MPLHSPEPPSNPTAGDAAGLLQQELGKRDPFTSVAQEAALNLFRTADQLNLAFERLFRQQGLTGSQYNILRILRGEGAPLPILEVAKRTICAVPGITKLIHRLESRGLVVREQCAADRRVMHISLTSEGSAALAALDPRVDELHRRVLAGCSELELRRLIRMLEKIRQSPPVATVV